MQLIHLKSPEYISLVSFMSGAVKVNEKTMLTSLPALFPEQSSGIVVDPTVECFLHAFCLFASRRSLPKLMLFDNTTTYSATGEELQNLLSSVELAESLSKRGLEWRFIPKRAPWFGGFG